jgi:hypothetical protein
MKRTLLSLFLSIAAFAVLALGPAAPPAAAYCDEFGIFWAMRNASGSYATATGAINEISMKTHSMDPCVPSTGETGSSNATGQTSRILLGGVQGNWVEVGWKQQKRSGGAVFKGFISYALNNVGRHFTFTNSCLMPGRWHFWRIELRWGGSSYVGDGYLNCNDGAGRRHVGTVNAGSYSWGFAEGEGFRRASTTMNETHRHMQWRNTSGGWNYASNVTCRFDNDSYWDGRRLSGNSFDIIGTGRSGGC